MPRIFISYRRDDSNAITGRIYDELARAFGVKNVFKDADKIPSGKDFRAIIESELISSDVMLVIIGPDWLNIKDKNGNRRLDDPTDFVRIEVEMGLRHTEVIPVRVKGASMPGADQLPSNLNPLAFKNARQVRDDDFHDDIKKLIADLHAVKGKGFLGNIAWGKVGAIGITVLTLFLTFLALLSEEWRNDFFYKIGFYTATPIVVVQNPTNTPAPPTNTDSPQASDTPQPPTETITPLPSDTPPPRISSTNTITAPSDTPESAIAPPIGTFTLTIFRDEDSLTLYVPETDEQLSLVGLTFQAETNNGTITRRLDQDYGSFRGMPYSNISSLGTALCFRLVRDRVSASTPIECQSGVQMLTQRLSNADVFWYDNTNNIEHLVTVSLNDKVLGICETGTSECKIVLEE